MGHQPPPPQPPSFRPCLHPVPAPSTAPGRRDEEILECVRPKAGPFPVHSRCSFLQAAFPGRCGAQDTTLSSLALSKPQAPLPISENQFRGREALLPRALWIDGQAGAGQSLCPVRDGLAREGPVKGEKRGQGGTGRGLTKEYAVGGQLPGPGP